MKRKTFYWITAVVLLIAVGAASYFLFFQPPEPVEWTRFNSLISASAPELSDINDTAPLVEAIDNSLRYFEKVGESNLETRTVTFGSQTFTYADIRESLVEFKSKLLEMGLTPDFFQYVRENFVFYRGGAPRVLYTGYYEADLKGSLERSERYKYPLYAKPGDLYRVDLSKFSFYDNPKFKGLPRVLRTRMTKDKKLVPYFSRDEIDYEEKLKDKKLELVWIDNPVDVFFLHIQGSGVVELDNGEIMRVNYAESNGHPYRAIGRLLIQRNALTRENVSMQSIRQYLEEHPEELKEIFNYNPSYVFFRKVKEGPMGCYGVPVTAFRSIATDKRLFPPCALVYIETEIPVFDESKKVKEWKSFRGFVLNQDTGGAIRTPARVDLFTGYGQQSRLIAGHMKQYGTFYFLIKKKLVKIDIKTATAD